MNYFGNVLLWSYYGWQALELIDSWRKGEKSGKEVALAFVIETGSVLGGIAGGTAGHVVGAAAGRLVGCELCGSIVGSVIGAWIGSAAGQAFIEVFFANFFALTPDKGLNEAYAYYDANPSTSVEELNKKYRTLAKQHHPDKGGSQQEFLKLNLYLDVIRQDRQAKEDILF